MLKCAREMWLAAAMGDFEIYPVHKAGRDMVVPDSLSRYHLARPPLAVEKVLSTMSKVQVKASDIMIKNML